MLFRSRLDEASSSEVHQFFQRYAGTYQEDRLRNDWLLELGRRRDWANFRRDHASYQMRDDREVACYAVAMQQLQLAGNVQAALLALQGPTAAKTLAHFIPRAASMAFMSSAVDNFRGIPVRLFRSGYTGEDGYEISVPAAHAESVATGT